MFLNCFLNFKTSNDNNQARQDGTGARGANNSKGAPNTTRKKCEPINGRGAPEVLLCLCGKYGSCTHKIFLANYQRLAAFGANRPN